jgi:hypothetical protein
MTAKRGDVVILLMNERGEVNDIAMASCRWSKWSVGSGDD